MGFFHLTVAPPAVLIFPFLLQRVLSVEHNLLYHILWPLWCSVCNYCSSRSLKQNWCDFFLSLYFLYMAVNLRYSDTFVRSMELPWWWCWEQACCSTLPVLQTQSLKCATVCCVPAELSTALGPHDFLQCSRSFALGTAWALILLRERC